MTDLDGSAAPSHIVLFDGVCGFCDWAVRWLIERDTSGRLHFAALQSEPAAALRARHSEIPEDIDTMVFVVRDATGERVFLRSEAVLRICGELEGGWRQLRHLIWIPAVVRDLAYRGLARIRYRLFGKFDVCQLPTPEQRDRFLA